jgi:hypothetical protein
MAIIGLFITGVKQATEHAFDAKVSAKSELNITSGDTLKLGKSTLKNYNSYRYNNNGEFKIVEDDNGRSIVSSNVRFIVRSTSDSVASITIEKEATGKNYNRAKIRAENIYYKYKITGNTLNLDNYLKTEIENKFSEQEVRVILYLPEGTVLYTDRNFSRSWRYSYLSYGNNLLNDMKFGHYYLIKEDTAECLDCVEENEEEEEVVAEKIEVDETINQESTSNEERELSVKINEEDGIDIQVNDN